MTTTPAHSKPEPAPADDQEGLALHTVHRQRPGSSYTSQQDQLAQEVPIALEYGGVSHATVLATPCDLEDFAFGFAYTGGVIRSARGIYAVELTRRDKGIVIELTIASACLNQLKLRRRSLAGRTGCGLCGLESLDEVQRSLPPWLERPEFLQPESLAAAPSGLREVEPR